MKRILLILCISILCFDTSAKVATTAKVVSGNSVSWIRPPRVHIINNQLMGYDRNLSIYFEADAKGEITHAEVSKSSGLKKLDENILDAFRRAKIRPYQENGVYYPITATQPFVMEVSREAVYEKFPQILVKKSALQGRDRTVVIYAEADERGNVTRAEIKETSGLSELDHYILDEYRKQAKFEPLIINGKPYSIIKISRFNFFESDAID